MAQAAMSMEARRRELADAAGLLSTARLKVALAGWGGMTRLGKLLEAIQAELYAVADEATLQMIAARFYEDELDRREFVARQLRKRGEEGTRGYRGQAVSLPGRGMGISVAAGKEGKVPNQGALPFAISGDGAASL